MKQQEYSMLETPETSRNTAATVPPRAWLEHFPAPRRSTIANWFHYAVRGGSVTPEAVVHQVQQTVQRRLQWGNPQRDAAHVEAVLEVLQTDRSGALAYAAAIIAYEQLPYEARQRVKAERTTSYLQEAMRGQPITERLSENITWQKGRFIG